MYEFRLCEISELEMLKSFLKNSWSSDHIFLKDQSLLDFQHKSKHKYNFIVAFHKEKKEFHGVLGVIAPSFYVQRKIRKKDDIWLAIWKVEKSKAESNNIGISMLDYANQLFMPKSVSAIGINKKVSYLYKLMGFKTGEMTHWIMPNLKMTGFNLLSGSSKISNKNKPGKSHYKTIIKIDDIEIVNFLSLIGSKKSNMYLIERYFNHPNYSYELVGIYDEKDVLVALAIGREVSAENSRAFRLTELFLEPQTSNYFSSAMQTFLYERNYEYIDFLEFGYEKKLLSIAGFLESNDEIYVPHLFEPFSKERTKVLLAYKSDASFICTKGDSDLDRPNLCKTI